MKNRSKFFCIGLLMAIAWSPSLGGDTTRVEQSGLHELKLTATQELLVACSFRVDTVKTTMLDTGMWGIWDDQSPKTIVARIKLRINSKEVGVPLSSYSDLANPRWAMLTSTGGGYRLVISGGDDGNPYEATIDFDERRVVMRRVQWMISPHEAWEMTIYSPPVIME